jgi:polysaccharide biosynthesis transport protein
MQKFEMSLLEYERILRKQYRVIVFCILMVMISSLFFMRSKTRLFRAGSSVKIDKTSEQSGIIPDNYWDNMETQVMVVTSFPVMELVAKDLGIIDSAVPSDYLKRNEKLIRIIQNLSSKVAAKARGSSTIIDIDVVSENPMETKNIANSVANSFKLFSKREKSKVARETRIFIEKQLNKCRADLSQNEMNLKKLMQKSTYPSIDEKLRHTLEAQADLLKENKELNAHMEEISAQMKEMDQRRQWASFSIKKDKNISDQEKVYIDWISSVGEPDKGLDQLNSKLLDLELKKSEMLNFYKNSHPKVLDLETEITNILTQVYREYNARLHLYQKQYERNISQLQEFQSTLTVIPDEQQEFSEIQRNISTNAQLYDMLANKYHLASISEASSADEVTVLAYAITPGVPFNINTTKVIIISLIIGVMLGVMIALLIETIDTSIGTIEDMEEYLKIPVIGVLAHTRRDDTLDIVQSRTNDYSIKEDLACLSLIANFDPKSPDAEAFRSLRTNIQFLDIRKNIKVINFTSSVMQEGKSTTLANLALTMAQAGTKTLLICCNLRRPSIHKVFGLPKGPGVIDILIEKDTWQNCVRTLNDSEFELLKNPDLFGVSGAENLHIITSGGIPPNPSELLQSKNMDAFLKSVRDYYDVVLVDGPPTLPVTDSAILGTKVDGTVIVYQTGRVPRNALRRAKMKLESVNTNVLGLVLNDTKSEVSGYFTGYYRYYMDDKGKTRKKRSKRKHASPFSLKSFFMDLSPAVALPALWELAKKSLLVQIFSLLLISAGAFKALSYKAFSNTHESLPLLMDGKAGSDAHKTGNPATPVDMPKGQAPSVLELAPLSSGLSYECFTPTLLITHETPEKSAKIAVSVSRPVYFVQISAWQTREQAESVCKDLAKKFNVQTYLRPLKNGDQIKGYRVCYGEYPTRDIASRAILALPQKDRLKGLFANCVNGSNEKLIPAL